VKIKNNQSSEEILTADNVISSEENTSPVFNLLVMFTAFDDSILSPLYFEI
jgi:hypothetical protein